MDMEKLGKLVLITGGARSGKSGLAEQLAHTAGGPATYIATAAVLDEEMALRVALHKERRPPHWSTVEETKDLAGALERVPAGTVTVIVDCLTIWLTNQLLAQYEENMSDEKYLDIEKQIQTELARFCTAALNKPFRTVVVTNEVGSGIVPDNYMGRVFRDMAGRANQQVARAADSLWLAVSGYPLCVKAYQNVE
ncbi:MAG TPA: bifunctional adenosylcobinamide kinase/adenosylcobinamide-phosphate guanylyltransferase [Oscillospiraceae bacterium]|nr:bifunctional adenosylcobinamide kinase/adenosylcobinamide-phosphate guanylyltransferase [Oscillospiraceae bacterium]